MQISRHWRMNAQRYRLEGVCYDETMVSLQNRPAAAVVERQPEVELETEHHMTKAPRLQKIAS